jgi:hypothetical protein
MVKFNRDGDLIVSCAKDSIPNLWRTETGERFLPPLYLVEDVIDGVDFLALWWEL